MSNESSNTRHELFTSSRLDQKNLHRCRHKRDAPLQEAPTAPTFTTDEETDEEIIEERDIKGGAKTLIREIEENNETIKTNKKIKTESVNQEYKKWFTFF